MEKDEAKDPKSKKPKLLGTMIIGLGIASLVSVIFWRKKRAIF